MPEASPIIDEAFLPLFETIASALEREGYVAIEQGLPETVSQDLLNSWQHLSCEDFRPANIGRGQLEQKNKRVRKDKIYWLDDQNPEYNRQWLSFVGQLKSYLNRRLFLGLFSFESHLAVYDKGDFYKKHVDAFKGDHNRVLSLVTYLNPKWQPGDGGQLVLYSDQDNEEIIETIEPKFATMVLFLSEDFPHEVLPANAKRVSVAGWFRINNTLQNQLDPPR